MAANASWNNGVTRMNNFTNSFITRLGGGGDSNSITLTLKNWNPADSTANQNISGATAVVTDDANLAQHAGGASHEPCAIWIHQQGVIQDH